MKNLIHELPTTFHDRDGMPARIIGEYRRWGRRWYTRYKLWLSLRHSRKALKSLNDSQLRDIGLTRNDLPYRDERKF